VLDAAKADLEALMRNDEEIAEKLDAQRFAAEEEARAQEVAEVIAAGAQVAGPGETDGGNRAAADASCGEYPQGDQL
jgi:hypothetical protein